MAFVEELNCTTPIRRESITHTVKNPIVCVRIETELLSSDATRQPHSTVLNLHDFIKFNFGTTTALSNEKVLELQVTYLLLVPYPY